MTPRLANLRIPGTAAATVGRMDKNRGTSFTTSAWLTLQCPQLAGSGRLEIAA
jgi:hypothetical protein